MYTNVRVSVETAEELKELKEKLCLTSLDDVIKLLLRVYKKSTINAVFGLDKRHREEGDDPSEGSIRFSCLDRDL